MQRGVQERADAVAEVLSRGVRRGRELGRGRVRATSRTWASRATTACRCSTPTASWSPTRRDRMGRMMTGGTPPPVPRSPPAADIVVDGEVVGEALVVQSAPGGLLTERDGGSGAHRCAGSALRPHRGRARLARRRAVLARHRAADRSGDPRRRGASAWRPFGAHRHDRRRPDRRPRRDVRRDGGRGRSRARLRAAAHRRRGARAPHAAAGHPGDRRGDAGRRPARPTRSGSRSSTTRRCASAGSTGSILELSRLETGSAQFALVPIDLAAPVAVALESSRALMESTGHTLEEVVRHGTRGDRRRRSPHAGGGQPALERGTLHARRRTRAAATARATATRPSSRSPTRASAWPTQDRERVFTRFWRARSRTCPHERRAGDRARGGARDRRASRREGRRPPTRTSVARRS